MYKNKYKDNYIAVIKALLSACREEFEDDHTVEYVSLYITKKNGLMDMSYSEVKEILYSLQREGYIEISIEPKTIDLLKDNEPHEWADKNSVHVLLRPLTPFNYFTILIRPNFFDLAGVTGEDVATLSLIPSDKKHKYIYRLAKILTQKDTVENYELAKCFNSKLTKYRFMHYETVRNEYNDKIRNRLKTLRKIFKKNGLTIKFNEKVTSLIKKPS